MRVIGEGLERVYARTDELALINIRRRLAVLELTRNLPERVLSSSLAHLSS